MRAPRMATSAMPSTPPAGSMTWPPRSSRSTGSPSPVMVARVAQGRRRLAGQPEVVPPPRRGYPGTMSDDADDLHGDDPDFDLDDDLDDGSDAADPPELD